MTNPKRLTDDEIAKKVAELRTAPYRRELVQNSNGSWFARIVEFDGCMTEGDSAAEALTNLDDAMSEWLRVQLEDGEAIPEPAANQRFSGKFMVRLPKSLHRSVSEIAVRDGVSINAFVATALARAVGEEKHRPAYQVPTQVPIGESVLVQALTGAITSSICSAEVHAGLSQDGYFSIQKFSKLSPSRALTTK